MALVSKRPVRVQLEDSEEWIEIKPKLAVADRSAFVKVLFSANADVGGEGTVNVDGMLVSFAIHRRVFTLLELAIVDWNLLDPGTGEAVSYNRDLVGQLDLDDPLVDKVLEEINTRNPTLSETREISG